jgi:nucleoid-associated protein YgaU
LITYVIQPGDTLARLAVRFLGSEKHIEHLLTVNPGIDPRRLTIGQKILIPRSPGRAPAQPVVAETPKQQPRPPAPKPQPRVYEVQPGDSFTRIAQKLYGDPGQWQALFELNRELVNGDPKRLRAGQEIRLLAEPAPNR